MSVVDMLRRTAICRELTDEELEMLAGIAYTSNCITGDIIFDEGSASDELYVILNGEIDVVVGGEDALGGYRREPITLTTLRRGQSFGEMALVSEGIRAATARCAQHDTTLIVIPRRQLMQLFDQYPRLGYKMMHNLAADLAAKIRATDVRIQERVNWSGAR